MNKFPFLTDEELDENGQPLLKPSNFPTMEEVQAPSIQEPPQNQIKASTLDQPKLPSLLSKITPSAEDRLEFNESVNKLRALVPPKQEIEEPVLPQQDDLALAQREARSQQNFASLLAGLSRVGSGLGAIATGKAPVAVDAEGFEKAGTLGSQLVKDIIQKREQDKKLAEEALESDLRNPNSDISKLTRDKLRSTLKMNFGDDVSAAQLQKAGFNLNQLIKDEMEAKQRAQARADDRAWKQAMFQESQGLRKEQLENLQQQRQIGNMTKIQGEFEQFAETKKARDALDSAQAAKELLLANTPISDSAVQRKLARLSGEVGVLTDQDVQAFGGSKALQDRLEQSITQMYEGKLTETNKGFMKQLINTFEKRAEDRLKNSANLWAEKGAKRLGVSEQEAMDIILPGAQYSKNQVSDKVKVQLPNGQTGLIPRQNLEQALKRGAKEIK